MKEIVKEFTREVKESKTVFQAEDGKEFYSKEQCIEYEQSALFAMASLLSECVTPVKDNSIDTFLDADFSRSDYFRVYLKTEKDKEHFLRYVKLFETTKHWYILHDKDNDYWKNHADKPDLFFDYREVELKKDYILIQNDDCTLIGVVDFDRFIVNFTAAWESALNAEVKNA